MIQVLGHPRSGTHYMAALVAKNLFNTEYYLDYYAQTYPHVYGNEAREIVKNNEGTIFVYVIRSPIATLKSVYTLRQRFGIDAPSYDDFLKTIYADMWVDQTPFVVECNLRTFKKKATEVSRYFELIRETPIQFWLTHVKSWLAIANSYQNVIVVVYDRAAEGVKHIARAYGKTVTEVEDVEEKVGWYLDESLTYMDRTKSTDPPR